VANLKFLKRKKSLILISIVLISISISFAKPYLATYFSNLIELSKPNVTIAESQTPPDELSWSDIKIKTKYQGKCVPKPNKYQANMCFEDAQETYHNFINCLFTEAISKMDNNSEENECIADATLVKILKETAMVDIDESDNTPIGFAIVATEEYARYRKYLDEAQEDPLLIMNCKENTTLYSFDEITNTKKDIINQIEFEKSRSKQALSISLQAYNEMRMMYPHHKRYECLISHLKYYRNQIANIRSLVNCLPSRFKKPRTSRE